ncbi:MAG TPA: RNA-binding protein [Desulfobulbaceae bacterium]|nr:RNA-binding protein [Desulfobulbaceae bacterium]
MTEFVRFIAQALADQPEQVRVEAADSDEGAVITLSVAQDDLGKMIGKQGRTARAMRSLLTAGQRGERPARLEIVAG